MAEGAAENTANVAESAASGGARSAGGPPAPPRCQAQRLLRDFWGTLGDWERGRALWLLGGLSALLLELFSYFYYQRFLGLRPCEYCVLIRAAMLGLALGGLLGAVCPKHMAFKLPAYALCLASAVWGLWLTLILEQINLDSLQPGFLAPCGSGSAPFPLGLPLDSLLPSHFFASGACGVDSQWSVFGFTMTQLLLMVYLVYTAGLCLMFVSWILKRAAPKGAGGVARAA